MVSRFEWHRRYWILLRSIPFSANREPHSCLRSCQWRSPSSSFPGSVISAKANRVNQSGGHDAMKDALHLQGRDVYPSNGIAPVSPPIGSELPAQRIVDRPPTVMEAVGDRKSQAHS